ncbi:MAG: inositol monophosphatase [Actinomycetota bacterium]|nr:inositol monophosphatase [Actinomycetota bacterium]
MSTSGSEASSETETSFEEIHRFVRDLARRTGELQLSRYQQPGQIKEKAPKDLLTEVDLLCEEFMISEIRERYPEDAILSEESGGEISPSGRTWLLDPLDGTANFSRSNPIFCACVSVVEGNEIKYAAVAAPRLGDVYHASLGGGAFRDSGGETHPLRVGKTEKLEHAFVGADVSFLSASKNPRKEGILEVFRSCWQLRSLGSAGMRGAWLAAGYVDVSIGTRNTVWDYAPTALLVPEAGGRVTDLTGGTWAYDSDGLLASNNEALHEEILGFITEG